MTTSRPDSPAPDNLPDAVPSPDGPWAGPPDPPLPHRLVGGRVVLGAVVVLVGLMGLFLVVATGRQDSALLFVGLPVTLAMGVTLLARPRTGGGLAFAVTTVALLLLSALLQEAAVCVLLAAPLVYGVTGVAVLLAGRADRAHRYAVAPLVLLALTSLEGSTPAARVVPVQSTTVTTTTVAACSTVVERLTHPSIGPASERGPLLRLFPYPTPTAASGAGLEVGDTWALTTPQGPIRTRVTGADAHHVTFAVTRDESRATRWVDLREGEVSWSSQGSGCRATLRVAWGRKLDPSWYFGPVDQVFFTAGAQAFLAQLTRPADPA